MPLNRNTYIMRFHQDGKQCFKSICFKRNLTINSKLNLYVKWEKKTDIYFVDDITKR